MKTTDAQATRSGDNQSPRHVVAQAVLQNAPYVGLRQVECHSLGDRLVLSGTVPSYFLKQLAQSLLLNRWNGAIEVDNKLEVVCDISTELEIVGQATALTSVSSH